MYYIVRPIATSAQLTTPAFTPASAPALALAPAAFVTTALLLILIKNSYFGLHEPRDRFNAASLVSGL